MFIYNYWKNVLSQNNDAWLYTMIWTNSPYNVCDLQLNSCNTTWYYFSFQVQRIQLSPETDKKYVNLPGDSEISVKPISLVIILLKICLKHIMHGFYLLSTILNLFLAALDLKKTLQNISKTGSSFKGLDFGWLYFFNLGFMLFKQ